MDSCFALGVHSLPGGALTTFHCKFGPEHFFRPWGARAPDALPGYAYGIL